MITVSPLGGAHAFVHKKACVLTTDEDMKDLHHRPEAISSTERQWLSERQTVTPGQTGCSSGQEVRLTRVGAPSRRCPEQAHQHQHEAVR